MAEKKEIIDIVESDAGANRSGRRRDGGVYLVVADESDEFNIALRYAARRAEANRAHVGILHVLSVDDFQHWGNVEEMMRKEMREKAEKFIWAVAQKVNELNETIPLLYIREGARKDVIVDVINEDTNIKMLVLGGGTSAKGPGALVSHFVGKGLGRLRVPVVVVPGHLELQKIDAIA